MKNIIFSFAFLLFASLSVYGQFDDKGYKGLKLGMTYTEAEKITPIDLAEDDSAVAQYDDLKFDLTFAFNGNDEYVLYTIKTKYKDAKLDGVSQNLIGKSIKEVKNVLGERLAPFEAAGPGSPYYIYYKNKSAQNNYDTSCVLEFNNSGVLSTIMASHNP
ncbi:hypothetical protein H4O20_14325 [Aequorivita sp. 609]|uniref:hypothetical protein n=1 Tax=Aequorivita TaxID=153265 RepID=UPI00161527F5|nr:MULTISPECIES: hypothetical protein [Aequorivita]MBB6682621.1 hypothetical protein [Aequorivita sp. 609]